MKTKFVFMNRPSDAALARASQVLVDGLNARLRAAGSDTELYIKEIIPRRNMEGVGSNGSSIQAGA